MTPAPYTRGTLDRIRKGASAADLGWDEERYRRICRAHGIEPIARMCVPQADSGAPAPTSYTPPIKRDAPATPPLKRRTRGPERRPENEVRSRTLSGTATPPHRLLIENEARRRGSNPSRLMSDIIEQVIERELIDELLGGP